MRIVLMVLRNFFRVPFLYIRLCKAVKNYNGDYTEGFQIAKEISNCAIKSGNVKAEIYGIENVPKEDGFIFYPNHQGLFDVLLFYYSSPRPFAFVIKKEIENIFLIRHVMKATGSLGMDRDDLKQSMMVIKKVTEDVKSGRNFLIFAEGTRSKLGNKMLDMKGGSFKAAQKAQCPIVPCAIINSFIPFDEASVRDVVVKLIYLEPIMYEQYKDMKTTEIADMVKEKIEAAIAQYL